MLKESLLKEGEEVVRLREMLAATEHDKQRAAEREVSDRNEKEAAQRDFAEKEKELTRLREALATADQERQASAQEIEAHECSEDKAKAIQEAQSKQSEVDTALRDCAEKEREVARLQASLLSERGKQQEVERRAHERAEKLKEISERLEKSLAAAKQEQQQRQTTTRERERDIAGE